MRNAARDGGRLGKALAVALSLAAIGAFGASVAVATSAAHGTRARCPDRAVETKVDTEVRVSLRCHGLRRAKIRILKGPRHGLVGHIDQRRDRVLYSSHDRYIGADRLVVTRSKGERTWTNVVR